jgi:hypothetical protein
MVARGMRQTAAAHPVPDREPANEASAARAPAGQTRLSVNLSPEVADALRELKSRYGTTTEAIRRAISTEKYIVDQMNAGARILIEKEGEPLREVVFR